MSLINFSYVICFAFSYFISSFEFAQNNYPKNKKLLYRKNIYFNVYGICHGIVSTVLLCYLLDKKVIDDTNTWGVIFTAIGIGLGINGLTSISFFDKKLNDTTNLSIGPKELIDRIERYLIPEVKEKHDVAIKSYIKSKSKHVDKYEKEEIIKAFMEFIPFDKKRNSDYLQKSYFQLLPGWEIFEIQEYYIDEFGVDRYDRAIKSLLSIKKQ